MDLFPLYNSLRVAAISTVITFFTGIAAAYYIARTPRIVKGVLDCVLTLPMVLPPTVVGFFLLKMIGPLGPVGSRVLDLFGAKLVMVGDDRQLQPIDAGGAFKAIKDELGAGKLSTIYRQKDEWARDSVH